MYKKFNIQTQKIYIGTYFISIQYPYIKKKYCAPETFSLIYATPIRRAEKLFIRIFFYIHFSSIIRKAFTYTATKIKKKC